MKNNIQPAPENPPSRSAFHIPCAKTCTIALVSLACLSLFFSCSQGRNAQTAPSGGKELVIQIGPNPETIDPALNTAIDGANYIVFAYEGLLTLDEHNQAVPGQAERWEVSEDGLEWTFHLREGLKWSDGSPLTADDFVYSWRRLADPDTAAPHSDAALGLIAGYYEAIGNSDTEGMPTADADTGLLGVEAPDPLTFRVRLSQPVPYFDKLAAYPPLSPVQQSTIEANGDSWATRPASYISNGPFYLSDWVPGSHLTLKKNPHYWNADAIKLDSIKCLLIEDSNAAYGIWQTGGASLIKDVPSEEISALKNNPSFHIDPIMGSYYLSMNMRRPVFSDVRVRRALSLSIDREYVSNVIMGGLYSPADSLLDGDVSDWDGSLFEQNANAGRPYIDMENHVENLKIAKELLAEAGYPGGAGFPILTYSTNDASFHKAVAEYLQQAWKELGITLNVEIMEWASFLPQRRSGNFDIARNGWAMAFDDPINMLELFFSSNGNNVSGYRNPAFDTLIEQSRKENDPEARFAILHRAEDMIMEDAAVIPIAVYNDFYLMSDKVTGWWHSPYGYWYLQYADITE